MTGPDTGGPPAGPGRVVAPLSADQRTDRYLAQTGSRELTPRQRRRVEHKDNRAAVRTETRQR